MENIIIKSENIINPNTWFKNVNISRFNARINNYRRIIEIELTANGLEDRYEIDFDSAYEILKRKGITKDNITTKDVEKLIYDYTWVFVDQNIYAIAKQVFGKKELQAPPVRLITWQEDH